MRSTDSLNGLLACPPMLLEFTFDQLRTLVVVQEGGSANGAARILGREQPSVQEQIDTLNRSFQRMCGELLAIRRRDRAERVLLVDPVYRDTWDLPGGAV